jgi:hypothetical protein
MTIDDAGDLDAKALSVEPLALPIDDAAVAAGVSRTRIYEAIARQELTARKPGRGTIIEVPELRRWIQSLSIRGRHPEMSAV